MDYAVIGFLLAVFVFVITPVEFNNTLEVNHNDCHVLIKSTYTKSDIKMVRQSRGKGFLSTKSLIYLINNKFTVECRDNGIKYVIIRKRRLIPINELLGFEKPKSTVKENK